MEIKAEVKSIEKLEKYFFNVPDYQREYVWKPDDQVEQFIIDIDNEYTEDTKSQRSYFIGSIILVENSEGKFDVIDGQQRLTTIILALCAFRDIISDFEKTYVLNAKTKEYYKSVQELLYKFDKETDEMQFRLELQYEDSRGYLSTLIAGDDFEEKPTHSIDRMQKAYQRLKTHFETYLEKGIDDLIGYMRYFLLRIELVVIETEELSNALKIFETINQRGAGLNAMDLVKNLIFKEAKEKEFADIKEIWKKLTKELEACNEINPLRFLRYVLIARYHDGVIREDEIYKWIISAEGKESTGYEVNPKKFAKELYEASKRYSRLIKATELLADGSEFKHVTNIGFVNKYKSRQHLLLLMALKNKFADEDIDYLAAQIESFLIFTITMGVQAKYNENRFATWAKEIRNIENKEELVIFVENRIYKYLCENYNQFKIDFLGKNDGSYNPLYRVRYIMGKMDNYLRKVSFFPEKSFEYYDQLQIEHILPQKPLNGWKPEEFADDNDYWYSVHRLGNITLVESTINQALNHKNDLQNNWFSEKCAEYEHSDILLTNLLSASYTIGENTGINRIREKLNYNFTEWNKDTIKQRQEILFKIALNTWKVNNKAAQPVQAVVQNVLDES